MDEHTTTHFKDFTIFSSYPSHVYIYFDKTIMNDQGSSLPVQSAAVNSQGATVAVRYSHQLAPTCSLASHLHFLFPVFSGGQREREEASKLLVVMEVRGSQPQKHPATSASSLPFLCPSLLPPPSVQSDLNKPADWSLETLLLLETTGNHKNTDFVQRRPRLPVKVTLGTPERSFVPRPPPRPGSSARCCSLDLLYILKTE